MYCPAQTQPDSLICPLQIRGSWQEPLTTAWLFGVMIPLVLEEEGKGRKRKSKCSPLVLSSYLSIAGMTEGEGHRRPLSHCLAWDFSPLPTSGSTAVPGLWVPGDPAAGTPAHQTPEKEESQKTVAVPFLSEAVPLTTAFSVLPGKAIEQMA